MTYLISILLIGISFAPFLLPKTLIWVSQGVWTITGIMLIYAWSLVETPQEVKVKNLPLSLLTMWIVLWSSIVCYITLLNNRYNTQCIILFWNYISLIVLYKLVVQYLDEKKILVVLECLRRVVQLTLFVCVLQAFGLSQYFKLLFNTSLPEYRYLNNMTVGFIGNGTHLSGFMGCCIPLFLLKPTRENILSLILMFIVLLNTGTSWHDPSLAGFLIGGVIFLIYFWRKNKAVLVLLVILGLTLIPFIGEFKKLCPLIFNDNGRLGYWVHYWGIFKKGYPISGFGLGKITQIHNLTKFPQLAHLHNEYFHYLFELGFIGLVLIFNLIHDFFQRKSNDTQFILKLMVTGFLVNSLFSYPSHLWLFSTWIMFVYAAHFAIENRR